MKQINVKIPVEKSNGDFYYINPYYNLSVCIC